MVPLGQPRWQPHSKPGVAADQYSLLIYVRGADGAVWGRQEYNRAGLWIGWHKIGGRVLPGTAPAAGYGLGVFIAVVGTHHTVWLGEDLYGSPGLRWRSIGGRSNSDPGLDVPGEGSPAEGRVVVFARGTDNAAWYNEARGHTAGVTAGWHSLGGALTSGVTAFTSLAPGYTSVYALGSDRRPWVDSGTWPELTRWQPVRLTG